MARTRPTRVDGVGGRGYNNKSFTRTARVRRVAKAHVAEPYESWAQRKPPIIIHHVRETRIRDALCVAYVLWGSPAPKTGLWHRSKPATSITSSNLNTYYYVHTLWVCVTVWEWNMFVWIEPSCVLFQCVHAHELAIARSERFTGNHFVTLHSFKSYLHLGAPLAFSSRRTAPTPSATLIAADMRIVYCNNRARIFITPLFGSLLVNRLVRNTMQAHRTSRICILKSLLCVDKFHEDIRRKKRKPKAHSHTYTLLQTLGNARCA